MELLKEGGSHRKLPPPTPIATQSKPLRGNHKWKDLKRIRACIMCRRDQQKKRSFGTIISGNSGAKRTRGGCAVCQVFLCRNGDCVERFHDMEGSIGSME